MLQHVDRRCGKALAEKITCICDMDKEDSITDAACMSTPYLSTSDDDVRSAQRAPMFDERRTSWVPREMIIGEVRDNNAQRTAHMQFVER